MAALSARSAALVLSVAAVAAGCGSSGKSETAKSSPTPSTPTTASVPAAVAEEGNKPVTLAFDSSGYLAACAKSLETPTYNGAKFSAAQAKSMCGCVQEQAKAHGFGSESEQSISDKQFMDLFSTCLSRVTGGATTSSGTIT